MSQTEEPTPTPPEPPASPEPAPPPVAEPSAPPARKGGFLGGLIGGLVAAGVGFGAAQFYPQGWPLAATGDLQAKLDKQAAEVQALAAEVKRLSQPSPVEDDLTGRVTALEAAQPAPVDLAPVDTRIAKLESRLAAIEALPTDGTGASPAAMAALQADVAVLKAGGPAAAGLDGLTQETEARLKAAEDRTAALQAETETMVAAARARTALGQLIAAMDSGAPYAGLLPDLGQVPEALATPAAAGVPTIPDLRATFPDAARAALEASLQADMGATWSDRIGSFLRTQTGARSLQPREGGDPDAILSRAEARLAEGDLNAALTELDGLPDAGKGAMTDWRARAEQRLAALAALGVLTSQIDG